MKFKILILIFCIASLKTFSQERNYTLNIFSAKFEKNHLEVFDSTNKRVYEKTFNNPHETLADLDNDGVDEFLVSDSYKKGDADFYTLYIYNTIDSFYVADSIQSGFMEPSERESKEYGGMILVTGNYNFDTFNKNEDDKYLPIECWHYENGKITSINDQIYNIFITENDTLIDVLDSYIESNSSDCNSIEKVKGIIASVYANYLTAGEKILAAQFLKKYYRCDDLETFKQKLNELLQEKL
jgi:hypothetical protein